MLRTSVFKFLYTGTVALLVLAFSISAAGAQPVQAANANRVSAGWMSLAGSVYDPQTDSHINVNGLVHIVVHWKSVSASEAQVDLSANLLSAGMTVTSDTGIPYIAAGAGQSCILFPNDPVFPNGPLRLVVPAFLRVVGSDRALPPSPIFPNDPIRPFGIGLQFDLVFSAAGVLDFNVSTVQVIELSDVGED